MWRETVAEACAAARAGPRRQPGKLRPAKPRLRIAQCRLGMGARVEGGKREAKVTAMRTRREGCVESERQKKIL